MTTGHKNWRWLTVFAIAVLAIGAVFSAACGDDDDGDDENGGTTPAAQTPAPAGTEPAAEETEPAATETEPAAGEGGAIATAEDPELGTILVDAEGLTLYTFTNDTADSGESACYESCASAWPPLTSEGEPEAGDGVTGELGTIERTDGTTQVTYNGMPLYYFASDTAPGDTNGHEVGGIWFVATP